ncbi:chlorophyll(ide) b reductase NOL, chloroplastic isoform X2 [Cornus florida]|uniref:chlorophyll(ide) b reductase NOL, chloroplastic isoform X2 n=1 Tax=Cornus florida TaxID=4283 RepID=UPI00289F414E|nr:chlorophyll(ide) b reductase NOL, chloroplastic isoform X2 [Cornus florida]
MAISTAFSHFHSPLLSPLLPAKHHENLFPSLSQPSVSHHKFDRCGLLNVGSRQKPLNSVDSGVNLISDPPPTSGEDSSSVSTEPMVPPYNVLITGSSKGIGYALAKEFLKAGDNVMICSRSAERVESALQSLRGEFGEQHVWGTTCDVREGQDVKNLVAFAQQNLKYIDIWINNAGSNAYSFKPLAEASDEDLIEVVTTNTLGLMICCREAIKMMLKQPRGGHIFNTDGAGSDGRPTPRFLCRTQRHGICTPFLSKAPYTFTIFSKWKIQQIHNCLIVQLPFGWFRFAAYGATKRSVVHLTKSLQAEMRMQDVKNVVVHNLSPGMVTTDLLMSGATTKQAKFFINVLAETAEVVAEYLVPSIRSILTNGTTKPTYIRFLTGLKAYSQIFSRLAFGARRNRYLLEE